MKITPLRKVNASVSVSPAKQVLEARQEVRKYVDAASGPLAGLLSLAQTLFLEYARLKWWPHVDKDEFTKLADKDDLSSSIMFDVHVEMIMDFMNEADASMWETEDVSGIVDIYMDLFEKHKKEVDDQIEQFIKLEHDSELVKLITESDESFNGE